jgi:small GTP-binding protein
LPRRALSYIIQDCDQGKQFFQFRVILIGDSTVGKSSLLRHFTDGTFAEVSDPTVGVDFFARLLRVSDGTAVKLQLWDTAGQVRYLYISPTKFQLNFPILHRLNVITTIFDEFDKFSAEKIAFLLEINVIIILVAYKSQ